MIIWILGKTPLDKARERNDEGHREVASILQSPADWITSPNTEDTAADSTASAASTASSEELPPVPAPAQGNFLFWSRVCAAEVVKSCFYMLEKQIFEK